MDALLPMEPMDPRYYFGQESARADRREDVRVAAKAALEAGNQDRSSQLYVALAAVEAEEKAASEALYQESRQRQHQADAPARAAMAGGAAIQDGEWDED